MKILIIIKCIVNNVICIVRIFFFDKFMYKRNSIVHFRIDWIRHERLLHGYLSIFFSSHTALCTFSNCNLIFSATRAFLPIKIEQMLADDSKNSIATPFFPSPRTFKTTFYKRPRTMSEQILRYEIILELSGFQTKIRKLRTINSILRILFAYYFQSFHQV